MSPKNRRVAAVVLVAICTLLAAEGLLRIQQRLGPLYDLRLDHLVQRAEAQAKATKPLTLHHGPDVKRTYCLKDKGIYGKCAGHTYSVHYNRNGIRANKLRPSLEDDRPITTVLFMGDSFMEGYDDANTVPQRAWSHIQREGPKLLPLRLLNAGCSSYSPALFIVQAKRLLPKVRPDVVVVDIDETDLGDDWLRYRPLLVRDEKGLISGIQKSPIHSEFLRGLMAAREHRLFIVRLFSKVHHTRCHMPRFTRAWQQTGDDVLQFAMDTDPDVERKYADQIAFFESNIAELVEYLKASVPAPDRILLLHHPHLSHLKPNGRGRYWNHIVARAIGRIAKAQGVAFYGATEDLRRAFGNRPQDYYWNGDMHLNFEGIKAYADLVAERLLAVLENVKDKATQPPS